MTDLAPNAVRVLGARYLRRDAAGRVVETPDDLFHRVARGVAHAELLLGTARDAEEWEGIFHRLLAALDFLPNSPTLMNAGTPLGQLAACFVLPVDDTIEGIFTALRSMALVQRSGGGTGFSFSALRPRGDPIASTGGEASGPVSFMRVFDSATESIKLGGRRRGANMAVLSIAHPDVLEFVDAKREGAFRNFNLAVAVTDAFMDAVTAGGHHALVHPGSGRIVSRLDARAVFERIVDAAWETGDPGLLFIDTVNRDNPTPALGSIETTNPCGEVPLPPWESCVLGSVNLARMVDGDGAGARVDWEHLRHTVELGVPESLRRLFVTATGMSVDAHLGIQAAFQRHVDSAVSKTVNLPDSAGPDAIAHAYLQAWRLGLKGITVYRTGSKSGQTLTAGADADSLERFAKCDPNACRV